MKMEHRCSEHKAAVGKIRPMLFVGIEFVWTPNNAVYGVLEMYRHLLRLGGCFDVVKSR